MPGEADKVVEYAKITPTITQLDKLIGYYSLAVTIESLQSLTTLKDIRERFSVENYLVVPIESIRK
tara:strand:- start:345 stop:542 length:198 start_codon:yes stop_codon:yes gene_type:complete